MKRKKRRHSILIKKCGQKVSQLKNIVSHVIKKISNLLSIIQINTLLIPPKVVIYTQSLPKHICLLLREEAL